MNKLGKSGTVRLSSLLVAILLSTSVYAGDIRIEDARARASVPGQDSALLDLTITSKQPATLTAISSPASKTVELHSMTHENGVMKMREVKTLELPAGKRINLDKNGYHLMLTGLNAPLKAGETVALTLTVRMADQRIEKVETRAEVQPLGGAGSTPQARQPAHKHH